MKRRVHYSMHGFSSGLSITIIICGLVYGSLGCQENQDDRDRQGDGPSLYPPLSYDGRYIAFYSLSTNLVSNDTNNVGDIFVHDRHTEITTRVSIDSQGQQADNESIWPSISGDGRYVAFTSKASTLVPNDTNGFDDVFVHDRETGTIQRASIGSTGEQSNNNSYTYFPSISRNGQYIAFLSEASNLVPGDTNDTWDVFVHDFGNGATTRVSVDSQGQQGPGPSLHAVISGNGRFIAFHSPSNFVPNDTNNSSDVFMHDRDTRVTTLVSVNSDGQSANGDCDRAAISDDGLRVAFSSVATNLVSNDTNESEDVFVRNLESLATARATVSSRGDEMAKDPVDRARCCLISLACCILDRKSVMSGDGQNVVFRSDASNLVPRDINRYQDIFVHNVPSRSTVRVSLDSQGRDANGISMHHGVSFDGRYVAFSSEATNLVPDDTNGVSDVFVYDRETGITTRLSVRSR